MLIWIDVDTARNVRDSRFLVFACRQSISMGPATLYPILHFLVWSLNIAFEGFHPERDYFGVDLPARLKENLPVLAHTVFFVIGLSKKLNQRISNSTISVSAFTLKDVPLSASGKKFAVTEIRGDWLCL